MAAAQQHDPTAPSTASAAVTDAAKMQAQAAELLEAGVPEAAVDAVMVVSEDAATAIPALLGGQPTQTCGGYDFNGGVDYSKLMEQYAFQGFQGTNLGRAIAEIRRMRAWRLSDEPWKEGDDEALRDAAVRASIKTKMSSHPIPRMINTPLYIK